jgi:EAL domain-containing protein (putative c-di-GMP-specific phosphodiesterase class I)
VQTLAFAEDIRHKFNQQIYLVDEEEFNLSVSMGILECWASDIILPYHKVKLALLDGRSNHKNSIMLYRKDMSLLEKQQELLKWAKKIKDAISKNQLKAFYQPMYDFKEQRITKYETLVRIVDDTEIISPNYFLPSAKITGLLPKLTNIVITQAFEYFKNHKDLSFSVNITDEDLKDGELFGLLLYLCAKHEIKPSTITLEILENINDYDVSDANHKLEELRDAGFVIALDDFGSESSNFTRLQQLNVDIIKIDALFVKDLDTNLNSRHIVETMIYLAKKTHKKTIAEFVHSKEIFEIVKELGVDYAQGYFVGQPLAEVI